MGNTVYQFKRFCRSVNREMLIRLVAETAPELEVDWSKVLTKNVDALYNAFIDLPPAKNGALDDVCREIYDVAGNPAAAVTIADLVREYGLETPDNFLRMSAEDRTLWLYLNCREAWNELVLWGAADSKSRVQWFHQCIPDAGEGRREYSLEQIVFMEKELRDYILFQEGRGYYCHCYPVMYRESTHEECFLFALSDHPRSEEEWGEDGTLRSVLRRGSFDIAMVFNWETRTLKVRAAGVRAHKICLCRIWAHCMRNATITDLDAEKMSFLLNRFRSGDIRLPLDELWAIEKAEFTAIGFAIPGNRASRITYEDEDGNLKGKIDHEARFGDRPLSAMDVYYVRIRVVLDKSFGHSRRQTLEIYCDRNNIPSLNAKVQQTLNEALVKWSIAA